MHEAYEEARAEGRSPYLIWLIWVVWLPLIIPAFLTLLQTHPTLPRLVATLAGTALFFAIYLSSSFRRAQRLVATSTLPKYSEASTWLTIAALGALSLVLTLLGGNEWQGLFYYTCGYVGGSLPVRWTLVTVAILMLLATVAGLFAGLGWIAIVSTAVFIPAIVFITRTVMWSITTSWELHTARKEIARLAVMTERLRIARDLHDLLGHNLSLITLKSELAGRLMSIAPERASVEIKDIEQVARTTLQEVREAVGNYRQPTLLSELQGAQEMLTAAGIACHNGSDENRLNSLPTHIEAVLAWTAREGVTNIIRHSRARQCTIRVSSDKHTASIEIIDDGVGITTLSTAQPESMLFANGNGLRGLAERVNALGGRFDATSHAGGGFRLAVSVPLAQRAEMPTLLTGSPE